jgi:hypothetical protein
VLTRASELHAAGIAVAGVLQALEQHVALPRGVWRDFAAARRALARQQIDPLPWIAELFALLHDRIDTLLRVLHGVSTYTVIPASPPTSGWPRDRHAPQVARFVRKVLVRSATERQTIRYSFSPTSSNVEVAVE